MPAEDYRPTLAQVGALLRVRTRDNLGNEVGTFNTQTRPTADEANELIDQALDDVAIRVGADLPADPPELREAARSAAALRAAMKIELSYFADQIAANRSPYSVLKDDFDTQIVTVERGVAQAHRGDKAGAVDNRKLAHGWFPLSRTDTGIWEGDVPACDDSLISEP